MHHFPWHIGDYRAATAHLNDAEDLAYRRLLDHYYDTEQPIPLDFAPVARRLRVSAGVLEIVLRDFFTEQPDGWHHARCDAELAKYHDFSNSGRRGAEKRWGAYRVPIGCLPNPNGPPNAPLIATKNQEPRTSKPKSTAGALATRLPADWMPSEADLEFCKAKRPDLDPVAVADKFRDYWAAVGGAKGRRLDWAATWRNWIRNESGNAPAPDLAVQRSKPCVCCGQDGVKRIGRDWYCGEHHQHSERRELASNP